MTAPNGPPSPAAGAACPRLSLRRLAPLIVVIVVSVGVIAFGWHRQLSFEQVARHHEALSAFIAMHELQAVAAYIALYIVAAALSIPAGFYLTVIGGILFGAVARRGGGPGGRDHGRDLHLPDRQERGRRILRAPGRSAGARSWRRGFAPTRSAICCFCGWCRSFRSGWSTWWRRCAGVRLATFAAATVLGIIPPTFIFAFFGAGLDSVITAQQAAYSACVAAGRPDCRLQFHLHAAIDAGAHRRARGPRRARAGAGGGETAAGALARMAHDE